jgi:hypothetical protein
LEAGRELFPEATADRVRWGYDPMEPWHLAYTPGVTVDEVWVDGERVVAAGRATRVDGGEVRAKAAEQARRLHARL